MGNAEGAVGSAVGDRHPSGCCLVGSSEGLVIIGLCVLGFGIGSGI